MFDLLCEACKHPMYYDADMTFTSCMKDQNYLVNKIVNIQDRWLAEKLVYKCPNCDMDYMYDFEELERKVRESIANDVMMVRRTNMARNLDPRSINPDNGMEHCGRCQGVDGDGNCYTDIIKQCTIKDSE